MTVPVLVKELELECNLLGIWHELSVRVSVKTDITPDVHCWVSRTYCRTGRCEQYVLSVERLGNWDLRSGLTAGRDVNQQEGCLTR